MLLAAGVAAMTAALQFVRHGNTEPAFTSVCQVCERDAARMLGALRSIKWELRPAATDST